jgi:putative PIN family toxin of toxin-antitoxin system
LTAKHEIAVIDTNTLISAAIFRHSAPARAVIFAFAWGDVLSSPATRNELREVIRRPKFDRYVPLQTRCDDIEEIIADMLPIVIEERIGICRDPKDNMFLELAVNGHADVIITGDADLISLHPFRGIAILNSTAYLSLRRDQPGLP